MFEKNIEDLVGITWVEEQQIAIGFVEVDGERVYEDVFAQETDAALGRDLAISVNDWKATRNYPEASLDDLCREIATRLGEALLGYANEEVWRWLDQIGMTREEFLHRTQTPST